jgi:hypothetical protein
MNYGLNPSARRSQAARTSARRLGWLSVGLGLAELLAPRATARATGLQGRERLLRSYGVREIATGVGILAARNPAPWLWARVAGDVLDLATLGARAGRSNPRQDATVATMAAVASATAVDIACASALSAAERRRRALTREYKKRSGLPKPAAEMRGAAKDFQAPADMQTPRALRALPAGDARV